MPLAADSLPLRASALPTSPPLSNAARHSPTPAAAPVRVLDRWQLVRAVSATEHAALFEARPVTQPDNGPADYLIKVARQADATGIAAALLRRQWAVAEKARHPNLAAVLAGNLHAASPYIVMANVGAPLRCGAGAPHSVRLALWRTRQAAAALTELHAAGWIHAHFRPSSLLVS